MQNWFGRVFGICYLDDVGFGLRGNMADFKTEVDLAERVIRSYEHIMMDRIRQGRCSSIEHRYQSEAYRAVTVQSNYASYPPEVYDMVKDVMGILARTNRNVFGTLMSKYSRVSPFYKRQSRAAMTRNQSRRYASQEWLAEIERSLWLFWQEMKKQPKFSKYFM